MQIETGNFDKAFLFIIGSAQLITSYIGIFLGITNQLDAIPFLLLGIALPFYIGYIRGAISVNKVEERIRGWLYFTIGMFFLESWIPNFSTDILSIDDNSCITSRNYLL